MDDKERQRIDDYLDTNMYQYFEKYLKSGVSERVVGIITNTQSVCYRQDRKTGDSSTHDMIAIRLEELIQHHIFRDSFGVLSDQHLYFFSVGNDLTINLPESGEFSYAQKKFLDKVLEQVEKIDQKYPNHKIKIMLLDFKQPENMCDTDDITMIRGILEKRVTSKALMENENIIGELLPKEEQIQHVLNTLDLKHCHQRADFNTFLIQCRSFFYHKQYQSAFLEVFPDYPEVSKFAPLIDYLDDEVISKFTFENMKVTLQSSINSIFKNHHTFEQCSMILRKMAQIDDQQKFPNASLLASLMEEIRPTTREQEVQYQNELSHIVTYEEMRMFVLQKYEQLYSQRLQDMDDLKEQHSQLSQNKIIRDHMGELTAMIREREFKKDDLEREEAKLKELSMDITFHQEMKESLQSQINELSKNKVQKLLSYKQISIYREKLRQLQMKYDDLLKKEQSQSTLVQSQREQLHQLEDQFKKVSGLKVIPSIPYLINNYMVNTSLYSLGEVQEKIDQLDYQLSRMKENIEELLQNRKMEQETSSITSDEMTTGKRI